ncbi:MAG: type II toxin-antitoxin system RelE/ParE family toxin [Aestuariivirgaceae bacterium]
MPWDVDFDEDFADEFAALDEAVKIELAAKVMLLRQFGPQLGRPHVDTLKGSRHVNMKELRFWTSNGVWRVAFAFDPARAAILLVAGDKSGMSERRFYRELIKLADTRFDRHLNVMAGQRNGEKG